MFGSEFDAEIINQFDKTAENYSKASLFSNGSDLEIILKQVHPNPTFTVLDIATGPGAVAMKISPFAKKVYAIDITPKMIALLEKNLEANNIKNVSTQIMHVENLKFGDDFFDVVTCRFAAHHFTDVRKFLTETKRVLKPHGKLVLEDIIAPSSESMANFVNEINQLRDHTHVKELSESEWKSVLREQGFTLLHKHDNPIKHDFADWFNRAKTSTEDRKKILQKFENSLESQKQFQVDSHLNSFIEDSMIFTARI